MRNELQNAKLIDVYEVAGREYLQVEQWQERARQERSKFPDKLQVLDISTPAADSSASLPNPASIDHRPSIISPSAIDHRTSGYAVPACFENVEGFSAALAGWIESRKLMKKPATGLAIQLLINRLSEQPQRAVVALEAAIERGWQTVKWDWLDNHERGNGKSSKTNGIVENIQPPIFTA